MSEDGYTPAHAAHQVELCHLLGIEPDQTTSVSVEWAAGKRKPCAHWIGFRILSDEDVTRLGELLASVNPPEASAS